MATFENLMKEFDSNASTPLMPHGDGTCGQFENWGCKITSQGCGGFGQNGLMSGKELNNHNGKLFQFHFTSKPMLRRLLILLGPSRSIRKLSLSAGTKVTGGMGHGFGRQLVVVRWFGNISPQRAQLLFGISLPSSFSFGGI